MENFVIQLEIILYHFLDPIILFAKNVDVNDVNIVMLASSPGDKIVYSSADSVTKQEYQ